MKRISPLFISCLIVGFVLVGGVFTAQAVEHSQHHAHHQKNTHGTFLCSWFCAAGQTLETHQVVVAGPTEWVTPIEQWKPLAPQEFLVVIPISRAPPFRV